MTLLVSGLSFEVKSGEILAVLATSQQEATGLLDVLAGVRKVKDKIRTLFLSKSIEDKRFCSAAQPILAVEGC